MNAPEYTHNPGAKIIQLTGCGEGWVYALTEDGTVLKGLNHGYWTDITPVYNRPTYITAEEKQS